MPALLWHSLLYQFVQYIVTGKAVNASEVDRTHETENLCFTGSAFRLLNV
jgi:hypothetical protein